MRGKHVKIAMVIIISVSLLFMHIPGSTHSWSNGGYSEDPSNPDYGTHDWIAEHALDYLPEDEKGYILNNQSVYLGIGCIPRRITMWFDPLNICGKK